MDEEKAILWQQRIQECMSSGLSVKRWCEEKGVSSPRFYYWKNRLEKKQRETSEKTNLALAIAIHQFQGHTITVTDYKCDGKQFSDKSQFHFYDHFGLDETDEIM